MGNPPIRLVFYNSDRIFRLNISVEHFADLPRWTDLVRGELSGGKIMLYKNLSQLDFSCFTCQMFSRVGECPHKIIWICIEKKMQPSELKKRLGD